MSFLDPKTYRCTLRFDASFDRRSRAVGDDCMRGTLQYSCRLLHQQVAAAQQFMALHPTSKRFGPSLQRCTLDLKNCDHGLSYHSSRAEYIHRRLFDSPTTATSKTSTGTARSTTHRESASSAEERALAHFQEVGQAVWYSCVSRPRGYHLDNCRRLRDGEEPT
jgi:hypothetical protein